MRVAFFIFSLLLFFAAHSQPAEKLLKKAYRKNSVELLNEFFKKWQSEIQPITENELQLLDDTLKNTYEVYDQFVHWINRNSSKYHYVLVQNSIRIDFASKVYFSASDLDSIILIHLLADTTLEQTEKERFLKKSSGSFSPLVKALYAPDLNQLSKSTSFIQALNFRPVLKINEKVLYLNENYRKILDDFLNTKSDENKKLFLERCFQIDFDPFNKKWEFIPYTFSSVTFDKNMQYVKLEYGIGEVVYMTCENGS
jgi:hypothetical protein